MKIVWACQKNLVNFDTVYGNDYGFLGNRVRAVYIILSKKKKYFWCVRLKN